MHKSRLGALVIDCRTEDLSAATAFWTGALGYDVAPDQSDDRYVILVGPGGEVKIDEIDAEVERLVGLGATIVSRIKGWVVLEAPSGHRFCVVRPQRPDFAANANPHA